MTRQYFGTDGIRGRVGKGAITPDFILKLGWAVGRMLWQTKQAPSKVLIGKDTRVSGYLFESALEAGLLYAGVNIQLLGPMPTPAIAYLTRAFRADIGIVISASHNPYHDNGFKFFNAQGLKISDEMETLIEEALTQDMQIIETAELGKARRIDDAAGRYIEFCKSTFPSNLNLHGLRIVVDCANGATYHVAPYVLEVLGAEVIDINTLPDGFNINAQCGSTHPEWLSKVVAAQQADLGIAFDGDGDRVLMIDHKGNIVDGDQLLYIIAKQIHDAGTLGGGVVGTEMSNLGLEHAFQREKIAFERAKVGDRYVMEKLISQGWALGGEASGHIVCLNLTSTGDGIISALQVLAAMVIEQKSLYDLSHVWEKTPQVMINVQCMDAKKLLEEKEMQEKIKAIEATLGNRGRCLIRASGTEPLLRIMLEGEDKTQLENLANALADYVRQR